MLTSEEEYETILEEIYELMKKGDYDLSKSDGDRLDLLVSQVVAYEKIHYPFPTAQSSSTEAEPA